MAVWRLFALASLCLSSSRNGLSSSVSALDINKPPSSKINSNTGKPETALSSPAAPIQCDSSAASREPTSGRSWIKREDDSRASSPNSYRKLQEKARQSRRSNNQGRSSYDMIREVSSFDQQTPLIVDNPATATTKARGATRSSTRFMRGNRLNDGQMRRLLDGAKKTMREASDLGLSVDKVAHAYTRVEDLLERKMKKHRGTTAIHDPPPLLTKTFEEVVAFPQPKQVAPATTLNDDSVDKSGVTRVNNTAKHKYNEKAMQMKRARIEKVDEKIVATRRAYQRVCLLVERLDHDLVRMEALIQSLSELNACLIGKPYEPKVFHFVQELQNADQKVAATKQAYQRVVSVIQRMDRDVSKMNSLMKSFDEPNQLQALQLQPENLPKANENNVTTDQADEMAGSVAARLKGDFVKMDSILQNLLDVRNGKSVNPDNDDLKESSPVVDQSENAIDNAVVDTPTHQHAYDELLGTIVKRLDNDLIRIRSRMNESLF